MGLILDTSVLIAAERRKESFEEGIARIQATVGDAEAAISTVTIVELTHGIYRARDEDQSRKRRIFLDELCRDMMIHPVTLEIAKLAGRIEGEQAAQGIAIAFEDLIIDATALHLGFDVATLNTRHFEQIPGLQIVSL